MKQYYFFVAFMLICTRQSSATTFITPGEKHAPAASYSGVYGRYKYTSAEFMYSSAEIGVSGDISSFALLKDSTGATSAVDSVYIYMKESNNSVCSGKACLTGYTQVYAGTFPDTAVKGWMSVTLPSAFHYNGTGNLWVMVLRKNGSKLSSGVPNYYVSYSALGVYRAAYYYSDTNPWVGSPAVSKQGLYEHYRPYVRLGVD